MSTIWNPRDTQAALEENVAIAAAHLVNAEGKYILPPITIKQAMQIGRLLWIAGYRKAADVAIFEVEKAT